MQEKGRLSKQIVVDFQMLLLWVFGTLCTRQKVETGVRDTRLNRKVLNFFRWVYSVLFWNWNVTIIETVYLSYFWALVSLSHCPSIRYKQSHLPVHCWVRITEPPHKGQGSQVRRGQGLFPPDCGACNLSWWLWEWSVIRIVCNSPLIQSTKINVCFRRRPELALDQKFQSTEWIHVRPFLSGHTMWLHLELSVWES